MLGNNKHNLQYFEDSSMSELFAAIQAWQNENETRFLSLDIEKDGDKFCCIALTNPTEVIIVNGFSTSDMGPYGAEVRFGALKVSQY